MTEKKEEKLSPYKATTGKIRYISGLKNESYQNALLAKLRRGMNKAPGEDPDLWGIMYGNMDESFFEKNSWVTPTHYEWAVYISITLFAHHQQGYDVKARPMHKQDVSFAAALSKLVADDIECQKLLKKIDRTTSSDDIQTFAAYLRRLIDLLKKEGIAFDYGELAEDIFRWQFDDGPKKINLLWGRKFGSEYSKNHTINEN